MGGKNVTVEKVVVKFGITLEGIITNGVVNPPSEFCKISKGGAIRDKNSHLTRFR